MCTNPRVFKDSFGRITYSAPCKYYCMECRNMRREEYTQRLLHEWETRKYIGSFITLTYRDDELPILLPLGSAIVGDYFKSIPPAYGSTISRKDLSQFCDKMQKSLKRKYGKSGKYIVVGEYGDDGHRPHYHGIYIGLPTSDRNLLYSTWNKGRVDISPISHADIRYTLSYIDKQICGAKMLYQEYGDFEPPFAHFSKGLGVKWIEDNLDKFDETGKLHYTDKKIYALPPYFRDKYNFIKIHKKYSDSTLKYAKDYHINDLQEAQQIRNKLVENSQIHKEIQRFGIKNDYRKNELIIAYSKLDKCE